MRLKSRAFVLCFIFVTAVGFLSQFGTVQLICRISVVAVARDYVPARPKNPLRLVVSRFPRYEVLWKLPEHEVLVGWLDTLECGHQVRMSNYGLSAPEFPPEGGAKRHRCAECAAVTVVKKPVQSVRITDLGNDIVRKAKAATA